MGTGSALVGRTLAGRFRVTEFLGEGAMACVYRGEQDGEPREVAIKVMHPHLATDRTFVGRFRREAKAAAQIHHPASVRILDTGVDGALLYIAMELLTGEDLFDVLSVHRRLPEARAAKILVQVCAALSAAHEQGIVHRDLKPENIMLLDGGAHRGEDRVKVLDFGIAKMLERDMPGPDDPPISLSSLTVTALTSAGVVVGTPAYMSPEQCRGETIDARSDVYACGVLLYQLVTGRLPFPGTSPMDFAVMHVRRPPTPPRDILPTIHPGLEAVLLRALDKFPTLRHQTASELGVALTRLLPELSTETSGDGASVPPARQASGDAPRSDTADPNTVRKVDALPTGAGEYRTLESIRLDDAVGSDEHVTRVLPDLAAAVRDLAAAGAHDPGASASSAWSDLAPETPTRAAPRADVIGEGDAYGVQPGGPSPAAPVLATLPSGGVPRAAPRAAPVPVVAPLARRRGPRAHLRRAVRKLVEFWPVPIALVVGMAIGTVLFFLSR